MPTPQRTRWQRLRRPAAFIAGALVGLYVGSYALLYRRGVAEADALGYTYFFYVPFADIAASRDATWQHAVLKTLYTPINGQHHR